MMQTLCTLRRWLRGLEPQVRTRLECSALARFQPWLERRALFRFQRQPLARGVAAGMFCGLIPGPLQIPGTLLVCAWLRGNIVAGGRGHVLYQPPHHRAAVCAGFLSGGSGHAG